MIPPASPDRRIHPAAKNGQFARLAHPTVNPGQIADRGRRSLRRLREWGIVIPRDCRLERAAKFVDESRLDDAAMAAATVEYLERFGEATRTIVELYLATHASADKPGDDVLAKFAVAVTGADTSDEEEGHAARDTQFELYVWGLLKATDIPCRFVEPPDLSCEYGTETVGIAAKRIWSPDQARKRISLGARQIRRSGLRGFIAINAQEYLSAASTVDDLTVKGDEFNKDVARIHGHTPYLASKPHVLGLLVCGTVYNWELSQRGTRRIAFSSYHQLFAITNNAEDEIFANQFADKQIAGLGRWVRDNM